MQRIQILYRMVPSTTICIFPENTIGIIYCPFIPCNYNWDLLTVPARETTQLLPHLPCIS